MRVFLHDLLWDDSQRVRKDTARAPAPAMCPLPLSEPLFFNPAGRVRRPPRPVPLPLRRPQDPAAPRPLRLVLGPVPRPGQAAGPHAGRPQLWVGAEPRRRRAHGHVGRHGGAPADVRHRRRRALQGRRPHPRLGARLHPDLRFQSETLSPAESENRAGPTRPPLPGRLERAGQPQRGLLQQQGAREQGGPRRLLPSQGVPVGAGGGRVAAAHVGHLGVQPREAEVRATPAESSAEARALQALAAPPVPEQRRDGCRPRAPPSPAGPSRASSSRNRTLPRSTATAATSPATSGARLAFEMTPPEKFPLSAASWKFVPPPTRPSAPGAPAPPAQRAQADVRPPGHDHGVHGAAARLHVPGGAAVGEAQPRRGLQLGVRPGEVPDVHSLGQLVRRAGARCSACAPPLRARPSAASSAYPSAAAAARAQGPPVREPGAERVVPRHFLAGRPRVPRRGGGAHPQRHGPVSALAPAPALAEPVPSPAAAETATAQTAAAEPTAAAAQTPVPPAAPGAETAPVPSAAPAAASAASAMVRLSGSPQARNVCSSLPHTRGSSLISSYTSLRHSWDVSTSAVLTTPLPANWRLSTTVRLPPLCLVTQCSSGSPFSAR